MYFYPLIFCLFMSLDFGEMTETSKPIEIVNHLRSTFNSRRTETFEWRKSQLLALRRLLEENEGAICVAMNKDLHKPEFESVIFETFFVTNEINSALADLKNWMKPVKVSRNLLQLTDSAYIHKQPLGVVLIFGAWNYPIQLLLAPLIGAIAAGNCVVLKPSHIASATETVLADLLPKYMDNDAIRVFTGGHERAEELLKERFDHIFFTGSKAIGKKILSAAAEFITPVTLELGGKCPAVVDSNADVQLSARRIVWGKFINGGQTCVAADFVICVGKERLMELVDAMKSQLMEFYGEKPEISPDFARIINEKQFDRLEKLINTTKGTVVCGGSCDRESLYVSPTIVTDVDEDDALMQDEIFGPILPIMVKDSLEEAIEHIRSRRAESPLAIYLFSQAQDSVDRFLHETLSGALTVNDIVMHMCLESLPFGGVGTSGQGRYHGKYSFDTFSYEKSVLHRTLGLEKLLWMRYPPYNGDKLTWAKRFLTKLRVPFT